jgi:hypothetical protein
MLPSQRLLGLVVGCGGDSRSAGGGSGVVELGKACQGVNGCVILTLAEGCAAHATPHIMPTVGSPYRGVRLEQTQALLLILTVTENAVQQPQLQQQEGVNKRKNSSLPLQKNQLLLRIDASK